MEIKNYTYNSILGKLSIVALLKHGTRWLSVTPYDFVIRDSTHNRNYEESKKKLINPHL